MVTWEIIRASGLLAYLMLSMAVAMGIAVRVRALDWLAKRPWVLESHQVTSLLALAFTFTHVVILLLNSHVPFSLSEILVPFAASWRPVATTLGTLSMYLVVLLVSTSYARSFVGQRTWRTVHYGGFAAWIGALLHGLFAGSDTSVAWVQYMYLVSGSSVAFLVVFRGLEAALGTASSSRVRDRKDSHT